MLDIDFHKVVPDTLHLFLRTSELLIYNLGEWAILQKRTAEFVELAAEAGVTFRFDDDKNGKVKMTDLDGKEAEKLMKHFDLDRFLEGHTHVTDIKFLWSTLIKLYDALRVPIDDPAYLTPKTFHEEAKEFARTMRLVYRDWNMTPYVHALVWHIPQFLELYGTIYQFNCQLVEKKNHQQTSIYHRGTQKGGLCSSACRQIMERENRRLGALTHGTCPESIIKRKPRKLNAAQRKAFEDRLKQFRAKQAVRRAKVVARRAAKKTSSRSRSKKK